MTFDQFIDNLGLEFNHPAIPQALYRATASLASRDYGGLPVPVRYRAGGGLRAWHEAFDGVPGLRDLRRSLADPDCSVPGIEEAFRNCLELAVTKAPQDDARAIRAGMALLSIAQVSSVMQAFWMRHGALYEPTVSLNGLLGAVDLSRDLPLSMMRAPAKAMCIIPPKAQRADCGGMDAVFVFTTLQPTRIGGAPDMRVLTLMAARTVPSGADLGIGLRSLVLPVVDENLLIARELEIAFERGDEMPDRDDASKAEQMAVWTQVLNYTAKVLLYLSVDDAVVTQEQPYGAAPKTFPGLGRRKRELRLAEVEQLYDRYVVGPARASDWAGDHAGELGADGQVSPHWRRGHFRMQAHGPQGSLRKLMFIKPMLIRGDRLTVAD